MNSHSHLQSSVKKMFRDNHPSKIPSWKRVIDLLACLIALPFFGVITLVMSIVLKIAAPGPIFFKQERVGYKGKRFMFYKFRTMYAGADTKGHQTYLNSLLSGNSEAPMVKLDAKGDCRVIPGGWLLRASGLDELPQIINVLLGEMSVVGPRPCIPYEYERYLPWQLERFDARPGLTGLWQVSGKNRTTFDEMIRLDIRYIHETSLIMDLRVIAKTIPALLIQLSDIYRARKVSSKSVTGVHVLRSNQSPKQNSQAAIL
jgi:exopolysaccharide production protein ExoY